LESLSKSFERIGDAETKSGTQEKQTAVIEVDSEITYYILNLTGSTIKFLFNSINKSS